MTDAQKAENIADFIQREALTLGASAGVRLGGEGLSLVQRSMLRVARHAIATANSEGVLAVVLPDDLPKL